jgi:hypothetical protein
MKVSHAFFNSPYGYKEKSSEEKSCSKEESSSKEKSSCKKEEEEIASHENLRLGGGFFDYKN